MIRLDRLYKEYGNGVLAVNGVDLEVEPGEFLCVIGPSGSGKTTLLRLVAGLEIPTAGTICIEGEDVTRVPSHKRDVPMVWQSFALFPHMNVRQNVEYGLKRRGVSRHRRNELVGEVSETLRIQHLLGRWTNELSGGEQQRVGLARALVLQPRALLLDEPLGSLDANIAISIQRQLKALQRSFGITFLYNTHNQSEALAMGDRIVVMRNGVFEQVGTALELTVEPANRFVAEFVGSNNVFEGSITGQEGPYADVSCDLGRLRGRVRSDQTAMASVAYSISADSIEVCSVSSEGGSHADEEESRRLNLNRVFGVIDGEEYRGKRTLIVVEVATTLIRANVLSEFRPCLGERVALSWKSDDAVVLPC